MSTEKKVIIMKLGYTLASLQSHRGDFEEWISAPLERWRDHLETFNVRTCDELPDYDRIAGVILSGSHAMVTDRAQWSERLASWLRGLVQRELPVLGICYGHQLLAHALGGEVADNPAGREFGTVKITFTEQARDDRLLGEFWPAIEAYVTHTQSVVRLPAGARRLGMSDRDPHQAFAYGSSAWGIQFHPEFDAGIVREYIAQSSVQLQMEGQDPQHLSAGCRDNPSGLRLLQRFLELVMREQKE
jgi:GMP synthase (glutamine-hydrolysing)